jgi:hypothetical protein
MPEWEYYFHGRGCCLTHKVVGDEIDVDFWGDSAEYFDTFFYTKYLESLRQPEPPEQRLRELHRCTGPVRIAVDDLVAIGALTPLPGRDSHPPCVSDAILDHTEAIETFCGAWANSTNRLWLGALCGDWLAAHEAAAGFPDLTAITAPRADQCRELRRQRLKKDLGDQCKVADALHALADLGVEDLDDCLIDALSGPPTGAISAALDIIEQQDDPRWCPHLYTLFRRTDPEQQLPSPHIWFTSLRLLLRHGYHTADVIAALPRAAGTGDAVLLALEHAPQLALPLIRKGLLSEIPISRSEVAAILAVINKPWSRRELLGALSASDDQEKTADARAGLLETGNAEAETAVLEWEERNPHENEVGSYLEIDGKRLGPFYTFGELALKNRAVWIRYEMDRVHDQAMKLKEVVPPEPQGSRPWWRLWSQ